MTEIIALHASPVRFDKFEMRLGGLHFGGIQSATVAVNRHLLRNRDNTGIFYLYKVKITSNNVVNSQDAGEAHDWEEEANFLNADVLKYVNRYEPDVKPSYAVFNTSCIEILSVQEESTKDYLDEEGYWIE